MAYARKDPLIKFSVVFSDRDIESVVWRRRDLVMSDQDVDDVAFLTGMLLQRIGGLDIQRIVFRIVAIVC